MRDRRAAAVTVKGQDPLTSLRVAMDLTVAGDRAAGGRLWRAPS
jgi:hypothetical protein